ncbi:MAG: hypothetical protein KatS3mg108_1058 [Isosphaeraceae bacterium]|jgi:hypothetical protein|nr:MAG: hypothetical protein KatS3mg108_1058 [Isosphaeraceae bacterium]
MPLPDRYRKRFRSARSDDRLRRQIATEAARRLIDRDNLGDLPAADFALAKRQAVSVLGQTVRPTDLPSDAEVRQQILSLRRSRQPLSHSMPDPGPDALHALADHLDRFTLYRLRLEPLQGLKLNPRFHPEGDALYHSLQTFDRARESAPFDEEWLLAALLHDVGRAIDPDQIASAGVRALAGSISERTAWLIEHLPDALPRTDRALANRLRNALRGHPYFDDLIALAEADLAARVAGAPASSLDEALDYIRQLDSGDLDTDSHP